MLENDLLFQIGRDVVVLFLGVPQQCLLLWPAEAALQADVSRWQCWQLSCWGPALGTLVFQNMVKGLFGDDSGPDPVKVAEGTEQFHKYATVLDNHLEGRDWLVGDGVTLADLSLAPFLGFAVPARIPVEGYGEIRRWLGNLEELPAWQATVPRLPG